MVAEREPRMKMKVISIVALGLLILLILDSCVASILGAHWRPNQTKAIDFAGGIANRERLEEFDPYCQQLARLFWYKGLICAEKSITPENCELPTTITYLPPTSFWLAILLDDFSSYHSGNEFVGVVSGNALMCEL